MRTTLVTTEQAGRRSALSAVPAPGGAAGSRAGCPVGVEHYIVPGTGGHGRARADALLAVIETFGCRTAVFGYNAARTDTFLVMTGTGPMLDALELLLPEIAVQMEQAARVAARGIADRIAGEPPGWRTSARRRAVVTSYFRDYLRGYGEGVADELRVLRSWMVRNDWDLAEAVTASTLRIDEEFTARFPQQQPACKERTAGPGGRSTRGPTCRHQQLLPGHPRSGLRPALTTRRGSAWALTASGPALRR